MTALRFERETCSRCGGSGSYSYCEMYGSTCFKCQGAKEVLTKRGFAAHQWMVDRMSARADELKVGDRVHIPGYGKFTIRTIEPRNDCSFVNGVAVPQIDMRGKTMGYITNPASKVKKVLPRDQHVALMIEALAYQDTLRKDGKPSARTPA